jgi:hypothetical protein
LVLGAQLLFGALFGLMGLMLADPIVAMIKVALEEKSRDDEEDGDDAGPAGRATSLVTLNAFQGPARRPTDADRGRAPSSERRTRRRKARLYVASSLEKFRACRLWRRCAG